MDMLDNLSFYLNRYIDLKIIDNLKFLLISFLSILISYYKYKILSYIIYL
jgi:hypothetical protein